MASTETVVSSGDSTNILEDIRESNFGVDLDISALLDFQHTFPDFELHTLLQTSPMGHSILKYYQTNNCLDTTRRGRLVDIIVKHLYNYIIKK